MLVKIHFAKHGFNGNSVELRGKTAFFVFVLLSVFQHSRSHIPEVEEL